MKGISFAQTYARLARLILRFDRAHPKIEGFPDLLDSFVLCFALLRPVIVIVRTVLLFHSGASLARRLPFMCVALYQFVSFHMA